MRPPAALLRAVVLLGLAGCTAPSPAPPAEPAPAAPERVAWREVDLPAPGGPPGRVAVRDAIRCGGRWYVAGGVVAADSRPVLWVSGDTRTWRVVPTDLDDFFGRRAVLRSLACSRGRLAAVGTRVGGAHGVPRVTTFHLRGDGTLVDVTAAMPLFGGLRATNVGPVTGGPPGFLVTGNRTSGPAVWTSPDAHEFVIVEERPGLADEPGTSSIAQAAVWDGAGWTVVGGATVAGALDREPVAWVSPDGATWRRETVPGGDGFDDLHRAAAWDGRVLALGVRGDAVGIWWRAAGAWQEGPTFGSLDVDAAASRFVASLAVAGPRADTEAGAEADTEAGTEVWATVSDGHRYGLWRSSDAETWHEVEVPVPVATAGDRQLTVSASPGEVLLVADDGERGAVYALAGT